MHWILQNNIFNEVAFDTLVETLDRFDISYSIHKVIPFIGELEPTANIITKNVICMGSYSLRHLAKRNDWYPGVFDLEPFDFQIQLEHWGDHMLNGDAVVVQFQNVKFDDLAFVRPIEDSKVFAGALFDWAEFNKWQTKVCVLEEDDGTSLRKNTIVQVCTPKVIHAEYRFWIIKGKIITASMYKRGNKVIYSSEVDSRYYDFVDARIAEWQPLETFVIDVCSIPGEDGQVSIKIVEINTLNSAGYYAGNVQKLAMSLHDSYSV